MSIKTWLSAEVTQSRASYWLKEILLLFWVASYVLREWFS